jgi:hypothetical protein
MNNCSSGSTRDRDLPVCHKVQTGSGPKQPLINKFQVLKRQEEHEAGYLPPSNTKFKNTWSLISAPPYIFMKQNVGYAQVQFHCLYIVKCREE